MLPLLGAVAGAGMGGGAAPSPKTDVSSSAKNSLESRQDSRSEQTGVSNVGGQRGIFLTIDSPGTKIGGDESAAALPGGSTSKWVFIGLGVLALLVVGVLIWRKYKG